MMGHRLKRDGPVRVRANYFHSTVGTSVTHGEGLVPDSEEYVRVSGQTEGYMMRAVMSSTVVYHERSPFTITTCTRYTVVLVNLEVTSVRLGFKVHLHSRV